MPDGGSPRVGGIEPSFSQAVQFWEPRRIWYNGALFVVVMLWLALT